MDALMFMLPQWIAADMDYCIKRQGAGRISSCLVWTVRPRERLRTQTFKSGASCDCARAAHRVLDCTQSI
eukprot:364374-Chlamydomonas_euryale.AAC.12